MLHTSFTVYFLFFFSPRFDQFTVCCLKRKKNWIWFHHHIYVAEQQWGQGMRVFFFLLFFKSLALAILFSTLMPVKQNYFFLDVTGDPFLSCVRAFCFLSLPPWLTVVQWWDWNTRITLHPAANTTESIGPPLTSFLCPLKLFLRIFRLSLFVARPSTDAIIAAARLWVLLTLRVIRCHGKHLGEENIIPGLLRLMISHAHLIITGFFFGYTIQREKLRRPGRECSVLCDAQGVKSERGN